MIGQTQLLSLFSKEDPFLLDCGSSLADLSVAYETHGRLNERGDNAILICHALTGDAHVAGEAEYSRELLAEAPLLHSMKPGQQGWWDGMVGPGKTFDTDRYFVICSNVLGSCYGTTGPTSPDPDSGESYRSSFPQISVRDMVHLQYALMRKLGVRQLATITGGSLGGMQVLEWALLYPAFMRSIIPIATAAQHSAWCIGINHLSREAIMNDPLWNHGDYEQQPAAGLGLARKIGMVSYRSDLIYNQRFARERTDAPLFSSNGAWKFEIESYLHYQGSKLVRRFDANSYLYLSRAMDEHDVARDRGSLSDALSCVQARTLCLGIDSDILYPAHEQRAIAAQIPDANYKEISSIYGHDAFLVEFDKLDACIRPFLAADGA